MIPRRQGGRHAAREALAAVVLGGALASCADVGGEGAPERLFPPPSAERVAVLLREIESPTEPANFCSLPLAAPRDPILIGQLLYDRAYSEVGELASADAPVDADLLRIVRTSDEFDSRCRAARALAIRKHPESPAILAGLTRSRDPAERYVAWRLCADHSDPPSVSPVPAAEAIERLGTETEPQIVDNILSYVGQIGARDAIPVLLEWAKAGRNATMAVWALGILRSTEALPVILDSRADHGDVLRACGRIGTKEAVDYVLTHIGDLAAMDALVLARDPRALPAVEAELARVRALPADKRDSFDERQLQIGLIRLQYADPSGPLLDLLEDPVGDPELRVSLAFALRFHCEEKSYGARLARIYAREADPDVLNQCWMALCESRASGVTEALLHHAQVWKPHLKDVDPTPLVKSINRRLGTSCADLATVRALATSRGIR